MTLLSASSKMEQMEAKCTFIHHRPITIYRLLSLPRLTFTISEELLCNIGNGKIACTCMNAFHEPSFILRLFFCLYGSLI